MVAQTAKNAPAMQEIWVGSLAWEEPLEKGILTLVFLPREFHGQRSLAGYSPWGHKDSGSVTSSFHFLLSDGKEAVCGIGGRLQRR